MKAYTLPRLPFTDPFADMLCLFGPPAVRVSDETQPLKLRPKALAVLGRVAVDGPESRASLAKLLFADVEDPRASLRWYIN